MESTNNFWMYDSNYWFQKLNSSNKGLSQKKAESILKLAANAKKIQSHLEKDVLLFLGQFKSPLMLLLIGAVILSAFLGDTSDVFIILFIVVSTALMSFFQERNASRVVEKLLSMIALKSSVFRDSKLSEINNNQVVEGDILSLKAGDMIAADCLLVTSNELFVNEASLTGESFPVIKEVGVLDEKTELVKRTNCLWEGTNIIAEQQLQLQ